MTVAGATDDGKAFEDAVMVTVEPIGGVFGAVYTPAAEIVPTVALPPRVPFTSQFTVVSVAPVTVPVKVFVFALPAAKVAEVGETVTVGAAVMVVTALTDKAGSSYDTAVTFPVGGEGTCVGAMYFPEVSILPTVSFPPGTPFTCQVTIVFVPPETPAWN